MATRAPQHTAPTPGDRDPIALQPRPLGGLISRAHSSATSSQDQRRAIPLTFLLAALAAASLLSLTRSSYTPPAGSMQLALLLVSLGFGSQLLSYNTAHAVAASVSLIPYCAAVTVCPTYLTVAGVAFSELLAQIVHRRTVIKSAFNVVQIVLSFSLATIGFIALNGQSFLELEGVGFLASLQSFLLPTLLLVAITNLVNSLSVSAAVAITTRQPMPAVWLGMTAANAKSFPAIALLSFYLSWLSVNLGVAGTLGLVLPMILARQLLRTTAELTHYTEELLDLMVAAIEARDPYTSGHSKRVARGSIIIARALGLRPHEIERVAVAALLHDVGKIDERFAPILAKEGRLTPEEWAIMKTHPVRSAELVGKVSSLRDIVAPVRHHHENWDGSGYPDGLKGEEIPLAARIIMFADTLDAITTDRPYRRALSLEDARAEFLRFRGRQFDPAICDRILEADTWKELYESVMAGRRSDRSQRATS